MNIFKMGVFFVFLAFVISLIGLVCYLIYITAKSFLKKQRALFKVPFAHCFILFRGSVFVSSPTHL